MRVLIVEDEERLAKSLVKGLTAYGFAADYITNGEKALTRISLYRNDYDAIVLDLMLPGMNGKEVCEAMRKNGINIPVLILTARNDLEDKVNLLNTGADDYLTKPFALQELVARLNALWRRPEQTQPVILAVGDISLDTSTRVVRKDGDVVPLTLKEFMLLEYFMRNPGRVINREEILEHLWDFEFTGFSNVVDVHVKNLRKKLGGKDGRRIATVRGVGYQLNP